MDDQTTSQPSVASFMSDFKTALLPEIKNMISEQLQLGSQQSGPSPPPNIPDGNSRGFENNAFADNTADEENSEDGFELDPLQSLSENTWTPPPETKEALDKYLKHPLDKTERKKIVDRFPLPDLPIAKTPTLDAPLMQVLNQKRLGLKNVPGALALEAVQSRMLDSLGPISAIHSAAIKAKQDGVTMTPDAVLEAVNHCLLLLGNANSQAIFQRQRSILSKLNPSSVSHLSKSTIPPTTSTELFGSEIRKSIKEAAEVRKDFGIFSSAPVKQYNNKGGRAYHHHQPRSSFRFNPYEKQQQQRGGFNRPPSSHQHQSNFKDITANTKNDCWIPWTNNSSSVGLAEIKIEDSTTPIQFNSRTKNQQQLGSQISATRLRQVRTEVVGSTVGFSKFSYSRPRANLRNSVGFLLRRLGSSLPRTENWRTLVGGRSEKEQSYQSTGTASSLFSDSNLLEQDILLHQTTHRQQVGSNLYQQNGWNPFTPSQLPSPSTLGMVCNQHCMDFSGIYSRETEHSGGLGVSTPQRLQRLEIKPSRIPNYSTTLEIGSGSVCGQKQLPTTEILELETGPGCTRNGCLHSELERNKRVRFPSILLGGEMHTEMSSGNSRHGPDSSSLEESVLVPELTQRVGSPTCADRTESRPVTGPPQSTSSNDATTAIATSSLADNGQSNESHQVSEQAENILLHSIRSKSRKSYNSVWGSFTRWCGQQQISLLQVNENTVVNYLATLHNKGLAYRTINLHRSAISYYIPPVNGSSIGSSSIVNKFMKGVFNLNPPQPKYTVTWDPAILLKYIDSLGPDSELNFPALTKKLVCLLALTKASRSSDICALDLSGLQTVQDGVVFKHVHLRKTSRPGNLPDSYYPSYKDNDRLCVVTTLKNYIAKTASFRPSSRLIITTKKPFKSASSRTVARWVLDFMKNSGIDTSVFKAHSIRGASTSTAFQKGASLLDVQKSADWSNSHTFMRFYYRQSNSSTFGSSVLSSIT